MPEVKRMKGTKAQGVAYEKLIRKQLEKAWGASFNYHQWFSFQRTVHDKVEYCEPEMFLLFKEFILLLECKRTGRNYGRDQMLHFYAPILSKAYSRPVRSLLICKNVNPGTPKPFIPSLESFLRSELEFATWHNLGI